MDKLVARAAIASAVERLSPPEKGCLRYHQALGTGIVCGPGSELIWTDGNGCGCLAVLATRRDIPNFLITDAIDTPAQFEMAISWTGKVFHKLRCSVNEKGATLTGALASLNNEEVWEAVGQGLL